MQPGGPVRQLYSYSVPWFLAPIDCSKIRAQTRQQWNKKWVQCRRREMRDCFLILLSMAFFSKLLFEQRINSCSWKVLAVFLPRSNDWYIERRLSLFGIPLTGGVQIGPRAPLVIKLIWFGEEKGDLSWFIGFLPAFAAPQGRGGGDSSLRYIIASNLLLSSKMNGTR